MKLALNTMRWALNFGFWGPGIEGTVAAVKRAEALGYDSVWTSEASGTDVLSPLAFLAAHTSRVKLGANVMQMAGRTPATTAMTAVTMDMLSGGRFILGLGASGPAVVEGWHNMAYGKPLARSREYLQIVREIIARQKPLEFHGEYFDIPYQREGATGLARPIKLMVRPRRPRIPTYLAALGPKNLRLAYETCDGLLPVAWSPDREDVFLGSLLEPGVRAEIDAIRQDKGLGPMEIAPFVPAIMGDDVEQCYDQLRDTVAFWLGAMGPKEMNFYNRLACRFGYEEQVTKVQELYVEGKRSAAARTVPTALIDEIALCGPKARIRDRLEAWKESSVTTMIVCGATLDVIDAMAELVL
jgi:F420-dependent oxidoreductase-like protein